MKSTTLLLIGGLAFAGTALAGDPTPQQTSGPSLKVGIDKKTGRLRPLTPTESAALDAQAAQTRARTNTLGANGKAVAAHSNRPLTMDQAMANKRTIKGITGFKMPEEMMSSVTATRNADGTVTLSEGGEPMQAPKARESASE